MMMLKRLSAASLLVAFVLVLGAGTAFLGRGLVDVPTAAAQQPGPTRPVPELGLDTKGEASMEVQVFPADDGKSIREIGINEGSDRLTANSTTTLAHYLKRVRLDKNAPQRVTIIAPPTLEVSLVHEVIDACRGAGFAQVNLDMQGYERLEALKRSVEKTRAQIELANLRKILDQMQESLPADPKDRAMHEKRRKELLEQIVALRQRSTVLNSDQEALDLEIIDVRHHLARLRDMAKEFESLKLDKNAHYAKLETVNREIIALEAKLLELNLDRDKLLRHPDRLASDPNAKQSSAKPEAFPLKHIKATEAQRIITELFTKGTVGDSKPGGVITDIRLTVDDSTNTIFIQASPTDLATIKKVLDTIDEKLLRHPDRLASDPNAKPSSAKPVAFQLKQAGAAVVAMELQRYWAQRYGDGYPIRVTVDDKSNTIFVQANPADTTDIKAIIERLDELPTKETPKLDGIWKSQTGEWIILGDRVVIRTGEQLRVASITLGKRGGYNTIDILLDADNTLRGRYAINGDKLSVCLLERIGKGGEKKKEFTELDFTRQKPPADSLRR